MRFWRTSVTPSPNPDPGCSSATKRGARIGVAAILALAGLISAAGTRPAAAQWTNRYPKVEGYNHHVYLEGYNLPTLTQGPIDPAVSPDGQSVAFASAGWIWVMPLAEDVSPRVARRVTSAGGVDARVAWSPSGDRLVFVRDDTSDTSIVALDLASGSEDVLVDTKALDLDPAFAPDGTLWYSSAEAGTIDLWRQRPGEEQLRITSDPGLELAPRPGPNGGVVYLAKTRGGIDELRARDAEGSETVLWSERIAAQTRPALSSGGLVALGHPGERGWELSLLDTNEPQTMIRLLPNAPGAAVGLPQTPTWSASGDAVLFVEPDAQQRFELKRIGIEGGEATTISIDRWDWGVPTGRLRVRTRLRGQPGYSASRLHVADAQGHPVVPDRTPIRFDGQNGLAYFYSDGSIEMTLPAGQARVLAVRGLTTPAVERPIDVVADQTTVVDIELEEVWDPRTEGWYSGDHHFHLNYGGPYSLRPNDLLLPLRAESIDVATPLLANLHNRFEDVEWWGWENGDRAPILRFAQEIRSHFLGHLGLVGTKTLFWPWIWGPGYSVYGDDDRPNAVALQHGRDEGGVGMYVHPVSRPDPFPEAADLGTPAGAARLASIPVGIIPDAVLGDLDALEVACLWSDELGTAELWYRFLNIGMPVALSAGTDIMANFYRTMAIGTTRVYTRPDGELSFESYLDALRAGRSFVTNGPLLDLRLFAAGSSAGEGVQPGDVLAAGSPAASTSASASASRVGPRPGSFQRARYELRLFSALPVERVEIVVNGAVVHTESGLAASGSRIITGDLELPAGGWIAVRAHGGEVMWPAMDSYPFAHTAPIWIGERASTEPGARQRAATELRAALDVAERRLLQAYGEAEIPRLRQRFTDARRRLEELGAAAAGESGGS